MTPKHEQLIDDVLWRVHLRTEELITSIGFRVQARTREQQLDQLRKSQLGQHLIALANYAEGHPYAFEHDLRASTSYVSQLLFRDPLLLAPKKHPHLPVKFHQTDLGKLFNDALLLRDERAYEALFSPLFSLTGGPLSSFDS
jgi:hypothetical protein